MFLTDFKYVMHLLRVLALMLDDYYISVSTYKLHKKESHYRLHFLKKRQRAFFYHGMRILI